MLKTTFTSLNEKHKSLGVTFEEFKRAHEVVSQEHKDSLIKLRVMESAFAKLQEEHKELELNYVEATSVKQKQKEDEDAKLKKYHDDQVHMRQMTRIELELCMVEMMREKE